MSRYKQHRGAAFGGAPNGAAAFGGRPLGSVFFVSAFLFFIYCEYSWIFHIYIYIYCIHIYIYIPYIQCAWRITRHRAISLSPRGRPARRFDPPISSDFESLGINFKARAVILGSWTLIFRISEMDVCFY